MVSHGPRNNFGIGMPNAQTHRSNFLSNDTQVLQQRLKELQDEMALLGQEEEELEQEQEALKEETENIKRHNKTLFDQITSNQEKLMLSNESGASPSQDIMYSQNSMQQLSKQEGGHQSQSLDKQPYTVDGGNTLFTSTGQNSSAAYHKTSQSVALVED